MTNTTNSAADVYGGYPDFMQSLSYLALLTFLCWIILCCGGCPVCTLGCLAVSLAVPTTSPVLRSKSVSAAAKSSQSCATLCDPIDGSPPGSHPWDSPGKNTGVVCHLLAVAKYPLGAKFLPSWESLLNCSLRRLEDEFNVEMFTCG